MIFIIVLILVFSVILHEISHGVVAYWFGDPTAKLSGRLTLNPVPHIDPLGTIILPVILVITQSPVMLGWARPVPFNPVYFKNKRVGICSVSLAGPISNIFLAIIFSILFKLFPNHQTLTSIFFYGFSINLILAIFNMIPIPPMDGSKVLGVWLPKNAQKIYFSMSKWGFFIIFILLYFGLFHQVVIPIYKALVYFLLGVEINL